MARGSRLTSWVVPFAIGLIIGLAIDLALRLGGGLNWVLVAIPFGAAGVTVIGSLVAEVFREQLQEDADRRRRLESHAESLSENALVWLQGLEFGSDRWMLAPRQVTGLEVQIPGGVQSVYSLRLWRYAEQHVLQDSILGPKWRDLTNHVAARQLVRKAFEKLESEKVEQALAREFGPGWIPGDDFGVPQPPRWYNAEVFWNWIMSRRVVGELEDQSYNTTYGRADVPNEARCAVRSGSQVLLSSVDDGVPRAKKLSKIITDLQSDPTLLELIADLERKDQSLAKEVEEFREPAAEFYERTVESKKLVGVCPVCA